MKKNLFMSLLLASAALLGSCDGNLSGGGDGTEGGSFEGGGMSKSYNYAADYYFYGQNVEGHYSHILLFTNIPYTLDTELEEGQALDAFLIYCVSDSEELGTSTLAWSDYFSQDDVTGLDELPCFVDMNMFGELGTSIPDLVEDTYFYGVSNPDTHGTKVEIVRDGDVYDISVENAAFCNPEDPDAEFNVSFSFRGPVKSEKIDGLGS